MTKRLLPLLVFQAVVAFSLPAAAERADRDKPVNLEADRITVDDVRKLRIFEGNVVLTQGTTMIRSDKLVVTEDSSGYQKGVATGGPNGLAYFRSKREGRDDYVEGEAERIEHDAKADKTELFSRAWVKSGTDEVRGQYISYDATTENYLVSSGPGAAKPVGNASGSKPERVKAVIQPRNKPTEAAPTGKTTPATP